jgi:hypothetical protein
VPARSGNACSWVEGPQRLPRAQGRVIANVIPGVWMSTNRMRPLGSKQGHPLEAGLRLDLEHAAVLPAAHRHAAAGGLSGWWLGNETPRAVS